MTNTETATARTAAEWETLALSFEADSRRAAQASADSFDRCDTDGFLSQWASDCTARLNFAKADWARNHGKVTVRILLATDGAVASTHEHEGPYGMSWVLNDVSTSAYGKRFFNPSKAATYAKRRSANARRGFVEALAEVDGYVKLDGSNATSVSPRSFPNIDALKAGDFKIVDADQLRTLSERFDSE